LREIELERMEVVKSTEHELVLRLPAFEEEGLAVEAALQAFLSRELGGNDAAALWHFMMEPGRSPDPWFGFGRYAQDLSFRLEPSDHDPDRMMLRFDLVVPAEERERWREIDGRHLSGSSREIHRVPSPEWRKHFLGRYDYLFPLFPDAIARFLDPPADAGAP
jgi:hypothetical protein